MVNKMKKIIYKAYILGFNTDENTITSFDDWWETHQLDIYKEFLQLLHEAGYTVVKKDLLKSYANEIRSSVKELEELERNLVKK